MLCSHCGTTNREGARFCMGCGTPLVVAEAPSLQAPPSVEDAVGEKAAGEPAAALASAPEAAMTTEPSSAGAAASPPGEPIAENAVAAGLSLAGPDEDSGRAMDALGGEAPSPALAGEGERPEQQDLASTVGEAAVCPACGLPIEQPDDNFCSQCGASLKANAGEEVGAPPPLAVGTVIAGRFEIVEVAATEARSNLYGTYDLAICPQCGFERPDPTDVFCPECGAERTSAGALAARQVREGWTPAALDAQAEDGLWQDGRFYLPAALEKAVAEEGAAPTPAFARGMTLAVGYASDVGRVRDLDEDSVCAIMFSGIYESIAERALGLFIVADGMGGHEGGEVASRLAVQTVAERLTARVLLPTFAGEDPPLGEAVRLHVIDAVGEANARIEQLARARGNDMGCTLTLALVIGSQAYIANVGDSRTYLRDRAGLRQVTTDHSVIASLIAAGIAQPEEIYTHPDRSVIYRALGIKGTIDVDVWEERLEPGDTLVLCCDGVWEAIRTEGIEDVLLEQSEPRAACAEMVRRANQAGGEDNLSVIVVKVETLLEH